MSHKRKKKGPFDDFFGDSLFKDMFEEMPGEGLGTGYSLQVTRGPGGTEVHVKAGEDTEVTQLRKQLQQQYPDAEIHIEGGKPLIRELSTKPLESKKEEKERKSENKTVEIEIE